MGKSNIRLLSTDDLVAIFKYSLTQRGGIHAPPGSPHASLEPERLRQAFVASSTRDLLSLWAKMKDDPILTPDESAFELARQFVAFVPNGQYSFYDRMMSEAPQKLKTPTTIALCEKATELAARRTLFLGAVMQLPEEFGASQEQSKMLRGLYSMDRRELEEDILEVSGKAGLPPEQVMQQFNISDPLVTRASSSFRDSWLIAAALHAEISERYFAQFTRSINEEEYRQILPKLKAFLMHISTKGRNASFEILDHVLFEETGITLGFDEDRKLEINFDKVELSKKALETPYVICPATLAVVSDDPSDNVLSDILDDYFETIIGTEFSGSDLGSDHVFSVNRN